MDLEVFQRVNKHEPAGDAYRRVPIWSCRFILLRNNVLQMLATRFMMMHGGGAGTRRRSVRGALVTEKSLSKEASLVAELPATPGFGNVESIHDAWVGNKDACMHIPLGATGYRSICCRNHTCNMSSTYSAGFEDSGKLETSSRRHRRRRYF